MKRLEENFSLFDFDRILNAEMEGDHQPGLVGGAGRQLVVVAEMGLRERRQRAGAVLRRTRLPRYVLAWALERLIMIWLIGQRHAVELTVRPCRLSPVALWPFSLDFQ